MFEERRQTTRKEILGADDTVISSEFIEKSNGCHDRTNGHVKDLREKWTWKFEEIGSGEGT